MDQTVIASPVCYAFAGFRVEPSRRLLEKDGAQVPLSSRAFDILVVLLLARERVVSRAELISQVWPDTSVDEHNLSVQMSALRRALGDGRDEPVVIATIPGRGYRFIALLEQPELSTAPVEAPAQESAQPERWNMRRYTAILVCGGVGLVLVAFWVRHVWAPAIESAQLSIVVMPFRDLSDDRSKGYLADAITDDLTTDLAHRPASFVIARESADFYKGRSVPVGEVGRALHVRYLLEGSLRSDGQALHINAQLVETETGRHIWADRFDIVGESQLLATQALIVNRIADTLGPQLVQAAATRAEVERPNNPDAIDLFLRARAILYQGNSPENWDTAQRLLNDAIEKAPVFPEALALLASLLVSHAVGSDDPAGYRDLERSRKILQSVLKMSPSSVTALIAEGNLHAAERNCAAALFDYEHALTIDPSSHSASDGKANCALMTGNPRLTVSILERSLLTNPLSTNNDWRYERLAQAHVMLGDNLAALDALRQENVTAIESTGRNQQLGAEEFRSLYLIACLALTGETLHAQNLYSTYSRIWPHRTVWRMAAYYERAQASGPGFQQFLRGLHESGMPEFGNEEIDDGVTQDAVKAGDFTPTPTNIEGGRRITTRELLGIVSQANTPFVIDIGRGSAVPKGAFWMPAQQTTSDPLTDAILEIQRRRLLTKLHTIVVLGDGTYGSLAYRVARRLILLGYTGVMWYRGGEEAWAAARLPSGDQRTP